MTERVGQMIDALYETPEGGCGCCLHIVLDDGNMEYEAVEFCVNWAKKREHTKCIELAEALLELTVDERESVTGWGKKAK